MPEVLLSTEMEDWLDRLKDRRAQIKIVAKITSMSAGNFGDAKALGSGVSEARIHDGPGYRLYYTRRGEDIYLLLVGGDKSSQDRDIALAKRMAAELKDDGE